MGYLLDKFMNDRLSLMEMKATIGGVMASATANCGNGVTVTCSLPNATCAAVDRGVGDTDGCICYDSDGNSDSKECPDDDGNGGFPWL